MSILLASPASYAPDTFDAIYYVRPGGPHGDSSGVGWANAFSDWAGIAFGTGAGQVGPNDLLCVDDILSSTVQKTVTQGGTAATTALTIAGSQNSSCNDGSDSNSGTLRMTVAGSGAILKISADYVTVRDITIQGNGTGTVGADGIQTSTIGVAQTGIQIGPNVLVKNINDDGVAFNSTTPGGVEVDCNSLFGALDFTSCTYSLRVDTTRNDGIACGTPGITVGKFQLFNTGRNTGGNTDGLAIYDRGSGSDCFGSTWKFFWIDKHQGPTYNSGSAAIDVQVNGTPPEGLETVTLTGGLITRSARCVKNIANGQVKVSGVVMQACEPSVVTYASSQTEYWNITSYGGKMGFNQTESNTTSRTDLLKNSLVWGRDAWMGSTTDIMLSMYGNALMTHTSDYNVYRDGGGGALDGSSFGYSRSTGTLCQSKSVAPNGCPLATWKTQNPGFGSPWDQNSQEVETLPFVGGAELPDVNQTAAAATDLLTPTETNSVVRLTGGHLARTAGTVPPAWVRDFCGNTYVDAGGGDYAVGAFEPSNTSCSVWAGVGDPPPPPAGPDKSSFGGNPATGGIW